MNRVFAFLCSCVIASATALAQPVSTAKTNQPTPPTKTGGPAKPATNAAPATATVTTNKPDIKQLIKGDSFTNNLEMTMVKLGPDLWASKYLVTQKEYQKVMGSNPSQFAGDRNPVDSVSWNDARAFCAQLTEMERKEEMLPEGFVYTLPTQAQWESMASGTSLDQAVTSANGNRSGTAPVGSLGPSGAGLYDTRGNVWQWCLDPDDKPYRVLRGGAWNSFIEINLRPEFRWYSDGPDDRKNTFGFRCMLAPGS